MKRLVLKAPAFVCAAVYLVLGWDYAAAMLTATTRNFNLFGVAQCLLGAVLFLTYGLLLSKAMPPIISVLVGFLNMGITLLPYVLMALLFSPMLLPSLFAADWMACVLPMLLSVCPFAIALWRKVARKR